MIQYTLNDSNVSIYNVPKYLCEFDDEDDTDIVIYITLLSSLESRLDNSNKGF